MRLSSRSCLSSAFIPASTRVKPSVADGLLCDRLLVAAEAGVGDGDEGGVVGARCEGPFDRGLRTALVGGPPHHDTLVLIDHIDPTKATAPPPSRDEASWDVEEARPHSAAGASERLHGDPTGRGFGDG